MPIEDQHEAGGEHRVQRAGDRVWLEIAANAYLHHMVRNIVGTLLEVQREADPFARDGAHSRRAATAAWPARPRRPPGFICGEWSIRRVMASQRPLSGFYSSP